MKKLNLILTILISCLILTNCNKSDNNPSVSCEQQVVISAGEYNSAPTDQLTINSLEIKEDCLKIEYSSSGCSGETWELKLIDSGDILESIPPQRNLILSLKNEELCQVYITNELTFDISSLQVDGNEVKLNITNTDDEILYEY